MNYAKLIDEQGDVVGVLTTEPGTPNEVSLVEEAMTLGLRLEPTTEDFYNAFEGDEIKPDWMD
jgi:hypothetical protein